MLCEWMGASGMLTLFALINVVPFPSKYFFNCVIYWIASL